MYVRNESTGMYVKVSEGIGKPFVLSWVASKEYATDINAVAAISMAHMLTMFNTEYARHKAYYEDELLNL